MNDASSYWRNRVSVQGGRATTLLDADVSLEYLAEQAQRYAHRKELARPGQRSAVVFRIAGEWLALPAPLFSEITAPRPVHSMPHRRDRAVRGIVNVRGELLVCVSLAAALGIDGEAGAGGAARLAALQRERERFAFTADEVAALHRHDDADLLPPPATVAHARAAYTRGLFVWQDRPVALLDEQLLFYTLNRSLA
jgi:chemotaxis-related protein WspD